MWYYKQVAGNGWQNKNARVVELVDSLDSGSSVHSERAGSTPASRTIIEPTVDTIISCRFVIFMRKTAVISRLFHLQTHPLSSIPSKQKNRCYRWNFV